MSTNLKTNLPIKKYPNLNISYSRTKPLRELLDDKKARETKSSKSEGKSSSSSSSIEVMRGTGNERTGSISEFPREVEQCVLDITSWYERQSERSGDVSNVYGSSLQVQGIGEAGFKRLSNIYVDSSDRLPDSLKMLLTACEGKLYLYEFQLLTCDQICSKAEQYGLVRKQWFPIAVDIDETYLLINLENGETFSCDLEEQEEKDEVSRSFGSYLEGLREKLLAHNLEFIEDSGLVEVVGGQSPIRSGSTGKK